MITRTGAASGLSSGALSGRALVDAAATATATARGDDARPANAHEAATKFEALLVRQLLDTMPLPGLKGTQAETFLSMVNDALADHLVQGGGLGLADQLERSLGGDPGPRALHSPAIPYTHRAEPGEGVTSPYGMRKDPFDGVDRFHAGVDLAGDAGAPIHVAGPGTVTFAGRSSGYGNLVVVDHGDGTETRYAHCDALLVAAGDGVSDGQPIATVGSTGRSTGAHLHFEVRRGGEPVDPSAWVDRPKPIVEPVREDGQRGQPPTRGRP